MYQQLFDILKSAIYGAESVLTTNQQFILDQVSTWGSIALTLAPVIAMVALTVKLLKW